MISRAAGNFLKNEKETTTLPYCDRMINIELSKHDFFFIGIIYVKLKKK
jgi:hypothetical protein